MISTINILINKYIFKMFKNILDVTWTLVILFEKKNDLKRNGV